MLENRMDAKRKWLIRADLIDGDTVLPAVVRRLPGPDRIMWMQQRAPGQGLRFERAHADELLAGIRGWSAKLGMTNFRVELAPCPNG